MNTVWRFLITFLALTGAAVVAVSVFGFNFGHTDFWTQHGILFLIMIAFFPRLTLLLSGVPWGGLFWWAGLIFVPRILVAALATVAYWEQNPILVVIAWLVALGGETSEKHVMVRRTVSRRSGKGYESAEWVEAKPVDGK